MVAAEIQMQTYASATNSVWARVVIFGILSKGKSHTCHDEVCVCVCVCVCVHTAPKQQSRLNCPYLNPLESKHALWFEGAPYVTKGEF